MQKMQRILRPKICQQQKKKTKCRAIKPISTALRAANGSNINKQKKEKCSYAAQTVDTESAHAPTTIHYTITILKTKLWLGGEDGNILK